MSKDFDKIKESDIYLDVKTPKEKKSKELQRTEKWREDRMGRWTGSQKKNLMSCSRSGGKMSWHDPEKIFLFGDTALKYIYENAMERKTGRYIDMGRGTKEMQYGTAVEPLIEKSAKKLLKKMGVDGKFKRVGFKVYPMISTAGVSSDGIIKHKKETKASAEMKACTNWNTHYDRTFNLMDEKSTDFWQVQSQMIAYEVDRCYYIVAEPPKTINKYLDYNGDILDLFRDFKKECKLTIQTVKASKMHQEALLKRIIIAEATIKEFLETGRNLKEILYEKIDYFKNNESELNIIKL